jgi:BMFP domain-containing protein YqiC
MSVKNFLLKKLLASKMQGVPQAEQDKIFGMMEKNPDLFQKIAEDVQSEMKNGKDQMAATMDVVKKYEAELKGLI